MYRIILGSLSSCTRRIHTKSALFSYDSIKIETAVQAYLNPSMESPKQVLSVKQYQMNTFVEDSIFRNMDNYVLQNISTVLFNRQSVVTVKDIVAEYTLNKDIYDNLKPRAKIKK